MNSKHMFKFNAFTTDQTKKVFRKENVPPTPRQSYHSCMRHNVSSCSSLLPSIMKILWRYWSYRTDTNSNSNTRRGVKSESKKARVVILVCNMSSRPSLHFTKSNWNNPKGIVVTEWTWNQIQAQEGEIITKVRKSELSFLYSSCPVLHFYEVSSKYSEGYLCYRAGTKSNSNTRRGDNSKSKKVKAVILVYDVVSSYSTFLPRIKKKYSKGYSTYSGHDINA